MSLSLAGGAGKAVTEKCVTLRLNDPDSYNDILGYCRDQCRISLRLSNSNKRSDDDERRQDVRSRSKGENLYEISLLILVSFLLFLKLIWLYFLFPLISLILLKLFRCPHCCLP